MDSMPFKYGFGRDSGLILFEASLKGSNCALEDTFRYWDLQALNQTP